MAGDLSDMLEKAPLKLVIGGLQGIGLLLELALELPVNVCVEHLPEDCAPVLGIRERPLSESDETRPRTGNSIRMDRKDASGSQEGPGPPVARMDRGKDSQPAVEDRGLFPDFRP